MKKSEICKVEGCNNKYHANGYCKKHYNHVYRYGKIIDTTPRKCKVEGCENKYCGKGYCKKHYNQFTRTGKIADNKIANHSCCSIEGCEDKHFAKGYCRKHYGQMRYHGQIPDLNNRKLVDFTNIIPTELYDDFDIVEIYKEILRGDRKRFPGGTWIRPDAISNMIKVTKYFIEEIMGLNETNVYRIKLEDFKKNKLNGIFTVHEYAVHLKPLLKAIYPEMEMTIKPRKLDLNGKRILPKCKYRDCNLPADTRGYCKKHYNMSVTIYEINNYDDFHVLCKIKDCKNPCYVNGYCREHSKLNKN